MVAPNERLAGLMAWTQTEVDNLKKAIAQGVLTVDYGDKRVTYRSLAEMKEILSMMQAEVAGDSLRATKAVFRRR